MGMRSALWASSSWRWPNVVPIGLWAISCKRLRPGSIFTIGFGLMKDWDSALPCNMSKSISFRPFLIFLYGNVYFTGYWTVNALAPFPTSNRIERSKAKGKATIMQIYLSCLISHVSLNYHQNTIGNIIEFTVTSDLLERP